MVLGRAVKNYHMADSTQPEKQKKILIVDDDEFLLDMYATKFKGAGFEVDIAQDGETVLEKMKKNAYQVILLDVVMPQLDGFELLRRLRKEKKNIKETLIVYLTNLGQREDIDKAKSLGANDFLIKANFTLDDVIEKINTTIK